MAKCILVVLLYYNRSVDADIRNSFLDKQRSTKHTHKAKVRVTRISLKTGGELRCS
jgi:hypothetical protein